MNLISTIFKLLVYSFVFISRCQSRIRYYTLSIEIRIGLRTLLITLQNKIIRTKTLHFKARCFPSKSYSYFPLPHLNSFRLLEINLHWFLHHIHEMAEMFLQKHISI